MRSKIDILKPGAIMSIQDHGRARYAPYGVPRSGYIDKVAADKVNTILGNEDCEAVLEWSLVGPTLMFPTPTYIAISHCTKGTTLNGATIRAKEKIYVPVNSTLKLGASKTVTYQYLAIKNGFKSKFVLDSQSGLAEYLEMQGLEYDYIGKSTFNLERPSFPIPSLASNRLVREIEALPGPDFEMLSKIEKDALEQYFTLSNTRNRMGIQFNELVPNDIPSILSVPIIPGTIQLTHGGKLILLGKDCQTTGGYPRILYLPEASLTELYQLSSGVKFKFKFVD